MEFSKVQDSFDPLSVLQDKDIVIEEICEQGSDDEEINLVMTDGKLTDDTDSEDEEGSDQRNYSEDIWRDGDCDPTNHPFSNVSCPNIDTSSFRTPLEFFQLFVTKEMVERICDETNWYAHCFLQCTDQDRRNRFQKWKSVTPNDIWSFLGLIIAMGLIKIMEIRTYWCTDELFSLPFFPSTMTRDRFLMIFAFLHCNDNAGFIERGGEGYDALFKIRPFLDSLRENFLSVFRPGQILVIGDSIVGWRGNLHFVARGFSHEKNKPFQCGIRFFQVCDSSTGYCSNFEFYVGQELSGPKGASYDMTMRLLEPFLDSGHEIYFDNKCYTSPVLFQDLASRKTNCCGTVGLNKMGLPDKMKKAVVNKNANEIVMTNGTINFFKLYDRKVINLLSSIHCASLLNSGNINHLTNQPVFKLEALIDYNKHAVAVSRSNNLVQSYAFQRRSLKWWKRLFFYFLKIAEMNAYIVYKSVMKTLGQRPMELKMFQRELSKELAALATAPAQLKLTQKHIKREVAVGDSSLHRLTARHFPSKVKRSRHGHRKTADEPEGPPQKKQKTLSRTCVVCSATRKRKESTIQCSACNVGLCVFPCFEIYHTFQDFGAAKLRYDMNLYSERAQTEND